jgi:hypothetical protein
MKVEVDLHIPDGYEFVRYGKMKLGEIGILPGVLHLHLQNNDEMYRNDYFIIKKKVKLTKKTRRYLYEDINTHREEVGLLEFNPLFQCLYPTLTRGSAVFFQSQNFIKWLEDDWQEYKI